MWCMRTSLRRVGVPTQQRTARITTAVPGFVRTLTHQVECVPYNGHAPTADLSEELEDDTLESIFSSRQDEPDKVNMGPPGEIAKMVWKAAVRNIRDDRFWKKLIDRVLLNTVRFGPEDVVLLHYSFARIGFRDVKTLDALQPLVLKNLHHFSVRSLTLLLNAHKKLDFRKDDTIELILQQLLIKHREWEARDVAMAVNSVAYFYLYQAKFWRRVVFSLPKIAWGLTPQGVMNIVSGMARVDHREARALQLLARLATRDAHMFNPVEVCASVNAFAKLDFNHPNLQRALIERVRTLGVEAFDLQAKCLLVQACVGMYWSEDERLIRSLMAKIEEDADRLTPFHKRKLKPTAKLILHNFPQLGKDIRPFLDELVMPVPLETRESRWATEVATILTKMQVKIKKVPLVHEQQLDYVMAEGKRVITCLGPYSYYANSTHRTAISKLHQRVLEVEGYTVSTIPHYEWREIKCEEDKMLYLWSLGRRVAKGEVVARAEPAYEKEEDEDDYEPDTANEEP
eukprot:GEMP01029453.1.p1 GENE.GEMP01029453.1~~GEMP01029453.1.p1  ORF type:complete len:514 (+),score=158.71 GEMP01029453.1:116-1657(+)